jgi:hypothetical protein
MKPKFTPNGDAFLIDNYNAAAPFADFLPALAGTTGKPMWVFYTNRGQGIAGFGVNSKDGAMMEFLPANQAYQATPLLGFRTLIKPAGANPKIYEPFAMNSPYQNTLVIRPYELEIHEKNTDLGLETIVTYFGVPNESWPALARSVTFKNIGSKPLNFSYVDGLARVVPLGMNDYLVKHMSRTIEAFAEVLNLKAKVPFFKLKIEPHDRPDIKWLDAGFFSCCFDSADELVQPVVDPSLIFGEDTSLQFPVSTFDKIKPSTPQLAFNIMPSAFFQGSMTVPAKQSRALTSYFGQADNVAETDAFVARVKAEPRYFAVKRDEMRHVYEELIGHFGLQTDYEQLNQYASVTFLDNVLRGGFPISLTPNGPTAHIYSRKHGDMERDYNNFQVSATYYSQGNGNFRDVNQNRRNDLYFNPKLGTANIDLFFNLLQLDGYNPLVINPLKFSVPKDILNRLDLKMSDRCRADYVGLIRQPALVGQIYEFIKRHAQDPLNINNQFRDIMAASTPQQGVEHGEGFWVDHWIYNLDLLDNYISVFPEKKTWLFYEKNDFTFHDSDHMVRPRREKYTLTSDRKLRQYGSVVHSPQKQQLMSERTFQVNKVRGNAGMGDVFQTNLFNKLLALIIVKISALDPAGVGLEMDADKPGWCDALNGLPGIIGSSSHEMYQLIRLVRFMVDTVLPLSPNKAIDLPTEVYSFQREVQDALESYQGGSFTPVWDKLATAREEFRSRTFLGLSGKTRNIRIQEIRTFLSRVTDALTRAQQKTLDPETHLPTSYFFYSVDGQTLAEGWRQALDKLDFTQHRVVPFLEGAVHALRGMTPALSRKFHKTVRRSELFDTELEMYKLNAPLPKEKTELGRIQVFASGWLENESIFLHMHYKYLLALLRAGLVDTFYGELPKGLIAFRDAATYGRSTFENSSFLASSAFPDPSYHGRGFVARLSGATSEFLSMIYLLAFGANFFEEKDGFVFFVPKPQLPREWFSKTERGINPKNSLGLRLFGVPVCYVNNSRKNTFGPGAAKPSEYEWILDGRFYKSEDPELPADASMALREGRLEQLTIYLK